MYTLQDVLIDTLWIMGLAGLLATLSYGNWYRREQGWRWGHVLNLPRILFSLCLSLAAFCVGLALNGATGYAPAPWWETATWSLLTLLFVIQTGLYGLAGIRRGWDTPMEEKKR